MPPRFRLSLSSQIVLALLAGGGLGWLAEELRPWWLPSVLVMTLCQLLGGIFLTGAKLLAVPMIVASAIEATVGLEATRGLKKLGGRTMICFAACSLLALLTGYVLVRVSCYGFFGGAPQYLTSVTMDLRLSSPDDIEHSAVKAIEAKSTPISLWPCLVLLSLGFGFYRNRIGEGRAHIILRFWRGVDDALKMLIGFLRMVVPVGAFALAFAAFSNRGNALSGDDRLPTIIGVITIVWVIYGGMILPCVLWLTARVNPWRYVGISLPAIFTALCGGSLPAALPFALVDLQKSGGISRRISGVVLPLGAALHRDGVALGWMALVLYLCAAGNGSHVHDSQLMMVGIVVWGLSLMNVPLGGLALLSSVAMLLPVGAIQYSRMHTANLLLAGFWIERGGAAVSQWSVACVAAIVAHWEGERDLLTPRPPDDPLFGERLTKDFI